MDSPKLITGYDVCQIWNAGKIHYSSDTYDVSKYNWKTKINEDTFRKHRDRFLYERIARDYESEHDFKVATAYMLYKDPKLHADEMVRSVALTGNALLISLALDRHRNLESNFEKDFLYLKDKDKQSFSNTVFELIDESIRPESVAILYNINRTNEAVVNSFKKSPFKAVRLIPKYASTFVYNEAKICAFLDSMPTKS
jgi:hypothetical protein